MPAKKQIFYVARAKRLFGDHGFTEHAGSFAFFDDRTYQRATNLETSNAEQTFFRDQKVTRDGTWSAVNEAGTLYIVLEDQSVEYHSEKEFHKTQFGEKDATEAGEVSSTRLPQTEKERKAEIIPFPLEQEQIKRKEQEEKDRLAALAASNTNSSNSNQTSNNTSPNDAGMNVATSSTMAEPSETTAVAATSMTPQQSNQLIYDPQDPTALLVDPTKVEANNNTTNLDASTSINAASTTLNASATLQHPQNATTNEKMVQCVPEKIKIEIHPMIKDGTIIGHEAPWIDGDNRAIKGDAAEFLKFAQEATHSIH